MRIRMIETRRGSRGPQAFRYDAGKTFYIPDQLARQYIAEGAAMEDKSLDEAPNTKSKPKRSRKKVTN